jgi:hypothetical protein
MPKKRKLRKQPEGFWYNMSATGIYALKTLASVIRKPVEVVSTGFSIGARSVRSGVKTVNKLDKMVQ